MMPSLHEASPFVAIALLTFIAISLGMFLSNRTTPSGLIESLSTQCVRKGTSE